MPTAVLVGPDQAMVNILKFEIKINNCAHSCFGRPKSSYGKYVRVLKKE
ncbi:MAG: hypothetical protein AAB683_02160 [Patescibacteria group bacterium]